MAVQLFEPDLDVSSLFSRSWQTLKEHLWPTVAVFVIYSLLTSAGSMIQDDPGLGDLIMYIIAGPITAGTYMYALRRIRGEEADLGDMFDGFRVFVKALGVFVLYSVMIVVGLVFLIVPGIYVAIAFYPCMYLVMDDELDIIETLRKAWRMTEGYRGKLFVVLLAVIGVNILGLIALLVGIIFTGALSLLVGAAVYNELAGATVQAEPDLDTV